MLLTTHPGLEAIALAELQELVPGIAGELRPDGFVGRVRIEPTALGDLHHEALKCRSIHHVVRGIEAFEFDTAQDIVARAQTWEIPELTRAYRVLCHRVGTHAFTSPALERDVGEVLFGRFTGPVRMKDWEVAVRLDVRDQRCSVGLQLTRVALSHRFYPRPFQQRTALKANVAYAALKALEYTPESLLDPFCGSGTMLLEANVLFPHARLCGSDRRSLALDGTRQNLTTYGVEAELRVRDATQVDQWPCVDAVVTNPPYGVRMGAAWNFSRFYAGWIPRIAKLLPKGRRAVVLATHETPLIDVARGSGLSLVRRIRIETGSVRPAIVVLERAP